MPTRVYECGKCEETFDYLSLSQMDLPENCTYCGSRDISRTFAGQSVSSNSNSKTGERPSSGRSYLERVNELIEYGLDLGGALIQPMTDGSVVAITKNRDNLN